MVRISHPTATWQRSIFNGWAQVIVQSTGAAGHATLKAAAPGLSLAVVSFKVK